MNGDEPQRSPLDVNPYQPGVDAHLPDSVAPGQTDPRAKRSAVLGGVAVCLYFLAPVAIVLGIIAMLQAKSFMNDWWENPQLRGRGAAMAGKIMGIGSVLMSIFMGLYFLWIYFKIADLNSSSPY